MAQKGFQIDQKNVCCSICLDVLNEPVTIPCGHSYCMDCITTYWDGEEEKHMTRCPQCRQTFTPRPVLVKSALLSVLVEELKKSRAGADSVISTSDTRPEDVACDVCTRRRVNANLQPHYNAASLKKHNLVEPSETLQENSCLHHAMVSISAERIEEQRELEVRGLRIQKRIKDKERDMNLLLQEVEDVGRSADEAVQKSERMVTDLIHLVEEIRSAVELQIRFHQEMEKNRLKDLREKLQNEITELKQELETLSLHQDDPQFPVVMHLCESEICSVKTHSLLFVEDVMETLSEVRDKLQRILSEECANQPPAVNQVEVLLSDLQYEPTTRDEFLKYSCEITLDPDTAHARLLLSEGNKKVKLLREQQERSRHPDRFTDWTQVLSRESLSGRCYWEVEWTGWGFYMALSHRNIKRRGSSDECRFGLSSESWALHCNKSDYEFWYNSVSTPVSGPPSSRIGVYVDCRAGVLSFYSISETMTLIHRVHTTFTQPLYIGLWLYSVGDFVEFCKLR